ncbi:MAG: phosphate uptake regulator PhoU [Gemmataceae bacterium]
MQRGLLALAGQVECEIQRVFEAIVQRSTVDVSDMEAEQSGFDLAILKGLAQQRFEEHELQRIAAVFKSVERLHWIAGLARGLGRSSQRLAQHPELPLPGELSHIAELVASMVRLALEALVDVDVRVARHLDVLDQEVRRYSLAAVDELVCTMQSGPEHVRPALIVQGTLQCLGAMAGLATDIAAEVIYLVDGEQRPRRTSGW